MPHVYLRYPSTKDESEGAAERATIIVAGEALYAVSPSLPNMEININNNKNNNNNSESNT